MVEIKEIILHCSVTHSASSNYSPFIAFFVFDVSVDPIKPSHISAKRRWTIPLHSFPREKQGKAKQFLPQI